MNRRTLLLLPALLLLSACDGPESQRNARSLTGGEPDRGKGLIRYYGCASCHEIPGIHGADGRVGPSLAKIGTRTYIAGVLKNNPHNLMKWIQNPPGVDPLTAMPNLHVAEKDLKDIAAYLYTLR